MQQAKHISGADALIEAILAEGIETVFGYPGGSIIPIYNRLYDYTDRLRHILVRHEQGAVHAAEGYARASGKVGVCLATSGPGATNFVTGIADAMMDSTPIVCITAQVQADKLGTNKFYVSKLVNNAYNLGFPELINILRVDYAEQYILNHRDAKQEEIARECGFLSASSFNTTFKKVTGMTPKVWIASQKHNA